jgi:hypothetical protein
MELLTQAEQVGMGMALSQSLAKIAQHLGLPEKVAATVSQERAQRAMDRLNGMEDTKPTLGQVGRYAGIGGLGGSAIKALGNVIEGYKKPTTPGLKGQLLAVGKAAVKGDTNKAVASRIRSVASTGVTGALGAGVLPLARTGTDRSAERRVLRKYINQYEPNGLQMPAAASPRTSA